MSLKKIKVFKLILRGAIIIRSLGEWSYKGSHDGAYTRFAFELGKFAEGEEVLLSIRVEDPHSEEQVRGKTTLVI